MSDAVIAATNPCAVDVEAGRTYWWCACGKSANQPFCDGSHRGGTFAPLRHEAERSERVWLCACKRSATPPFCDGSHRRLGAD